VEGDVATAVAFEEFNAAFGEEFRGCDYVCGFGIAAQRDYWLVFEQEEDIANFFFFTQGDELLLEA
jgi:hypothetical protein